MTFNKETILRQTYLHNYITALDYQNSSRILISTCKKKAASMEAMYINLCVDNNIIKYTSKVP